MKRIAVALWSFAFINLAQQASAQDALSPPSGSNLLLAAEASGVQVYVCTAKEKGFVWIFDGPAASLFNHSGREIGTHGKGPMWTLADGSAITGDLLAKSDAPEAGSVPWLLLKVKTHLGTFGTLSSVNYIRRIDTKGGVEPPDGCDAAHLGDIARIRYSAVYQFYAQ
ncbi:conserved exported hypothetical protein [Methylocella tundrae]|uniref:DUF3455 domain-containing protein n=1 Tax=Methylocella tundrae TaxID=227605 RepID=A0A8B6MB33_METTU|nr:DUF3455 domain-containing protein [Methylocella tundrae]VTZ52247.1 conserved exported hypothetical protein [Methylocella tundrae]